jgi:hypothetical protein
MQASSGGWRTQDSSGQRVRGRHRCNASHREGGFQKLAAIHANATLCRSIAAVKAGGGGHHSQIFPEEARAGGFWYRSRQEPFAVPANEKSRFMYNPLLNRKSATDHAVKHLTELIPVSGSPVLEEHFVKDDIWHITLSYLPAGTGTQNGHAAAKEYKTLTVDARTGEVLSMKIRAVNA